MASNTVSLNSTQNITENEKIRELYENNSDFIDFIKFAIKNKIYNVKIMKNIGYRIIDTEGNISDEIYSYEGIEYTKETFKAEIENYKTELIKSGIPIIGNDLTDNDLETIFGANTHMIIIDMFNTITEIIDDEEHYIYNMIFKLYNFDSDYISVISPFYHFCEPINPSTLLMTINDYVNDNYTYIMYKNSLKSVINYDNADFMLKLHNLLLTDFIDFNKFIITHEDFEDEYSILENYIKKNNIRDIHIEYRNIQNNTNIDFDINNILKLQSITNIKHLEIISFNVKGDIIRLEEIDNLDLTIIGCKINYNIFNIKSLIKLTINFSHNHLHININSLPKLRHISINGGLIDSVNIHNLPELNYLSLPYFECDIPSDFHISSLPVLKEFKLKYRFTYNKKSRAKFNYINVSELLSNELTNVEKLEIDNYYNMNMISDKFINLTLANLINLKNVNLYGCYILINDEEELEEFNNLIRKWKMEISNLEIKNSYYIYNDKRVRITEFY